MIKSDTETKIVCNVCHQEAFQREVFLVDQGQARKISYDTHHESIVDAEHIAALRRAEAFYVGIFDLINAFKRLSEDERIVYVEDPKAAGILTELDIGSERPAACRIRTTIVPYFTLKTFKAIREVPLEPRYLEGVTLDQLLEEIRERVKPMIEEARDRALMGLG